MAGPNKTSSKQRQRQRIVRRLHREGFAIKGFNPDAPDALQPRLRSWVRKEAAKTVNTAFAPAEAALGSRESQINALNSKRERDNLAFHAWLDSKQKLIRDETAARDAELRGQVQQQQADLTNQLTAVTAEAQKRLSASGVQSGTIDSAGVVSGAQKAAIETGAARATHLTEGQVTGQGLLAANQANAHLATRAQEAREYAASLKDLADVADSRTKLAFQKASALAEQISKGLDQELAKAQFNVQTQAAANKLNLDLFKTRADIRDKDAQRTIDRRNRTVDDANKDADRAQKDRQAALDFETKYGVTPEQWRRFSASHKQRIIRNLGGGAGGKGGSKGRGVEDRNRIRKAKNDLNNSLALALGRRLPQGKDPVTGGEWAAAPPAKVGGGRELSGWIQQVSGVDASIADAAAFYAIYGRNAHLPAKLRRALMRDHGIGGRK